MVASDMSTAIVDKAACGCTVKRGGHVYEVKVWTVDVYDREGKPIDTIDAPGGTERAAKSHLLVDLYRRGLDVRKHGWLLVPAGYVIHQRECCRDARPCWACTMRADSPA